MSRGKGSFKLPNVDGPEVNAPAPFADAPVQNVDTSDTTPATPGDYSDAPVSKTPVEQLHAQYAATDADRNAQVRDLSEQTGEHPAFVDKNLPAIKQAAAAPAPSFFQQLDSQYPGTTDFLKKPENMAVSHDDVGNLAAHEGLFQAASGFFSSEKNALLAGYEGSATGLIARGKLPEHHLPEHPGVIEGLTAQLGGLVPDLPLMAAAAPIGEAVGGVAGAAAGSVVPGFGTIAGAIGGGVAGAGAAGFALPGMVKQALLKKYQSGDVKGAEASWGDILDAVKEGATSSDVWKEGAKQGLVGAATTLTGGLATGLGAGTLTKLLAENAVMTVGGAAVEGKAPTAREFLDNFLTVGALHVATGAPGYLREQHQAEMAKKFYGALGDTAEASKLRERLPDAYQKQVAALTKDGPVEHVYIPATAAETYFQSKNLDPEKVMAELGASDAYAEAKATGGDIKIPLADWVAKLDKEHFKGLEDDVKFDPEALTKNEAAAHYEEKKAQLQKILDARDGAADVAAQSAGGEYAPQIPALFDENYHMLRAAGMSDFEARHNAIVHDQFFSRMGEHFGVPGEQIAREFPLTIGNGLKDTSFDFGANAEGPEATAGMSPEDAQTWKEASQGAKVERMQMARRALEAIPDVHKDDVAEALGLPVMAVRRLRNTSERLGRGAYSKEEILKAAGSTGFEQSGIVDEGGDGGQQRQADDSRGAGSGRGADQQRALSRPLEALPKTSPGHLESIRESARRYVKDAGIPERQQHEYVKADPERGARLAKAYDEMIHDPENPAVKKSYDALIKETIAQFHELVKTGIKIERIEPGQENPYPKGPKQALEDIKNGHLWFYPTESGFGTGGDTTGHPMLAETDIEIGGKKLLANDAFRIVHDVYGHAKEGVGFGPDGEENAWQSHVRMYSDEARPAMTAETRGQNSWVNYGPNGEANRAAPHDTVYADQKAGLLPDWAHEEGMASDRKELFQNEPDPRGRIQIGGKNFNIDLLKGADQSTFIHETGHLFLEVMKSVAAKEDAPEVLKKDFQAIRDWMGLKDGEKIETEHHEKWASTFEQYMREGKAPSESLEKTFNVFRRFITDVYKKLKILGADLSPEIRGVMDRMLASDEEIKRASMFSGYEMKDLPSDIPIDVRDKIRDLQTRARDQAESSLLRDQMKEITTEHKEALKVESQRLDALARPEVEKLPIFQAVESLRFDGERESDPYTLAEKGLRGEFTPEEASAFEVAAEQHGFASGEDLAHQIVDAKDTNLFEREVKSRVAEGLKQHADLKDTAKIRDKALEYIHTNRTTELLALEREALASLVKDATVKSEKRQAVENKEIGKLIGKQRDLRERIANEREQKNFDKAQSEASDREAAELDKQIKRAEESVAQDKFRAQVKIEAKAAKDTAKALLDSKPIKDAGSARIFVTAERRAAERAARALAKKDYEAATQAKQEQLLNHALAAEAMKNKVEIDKAVKKLSDISRRDNLKDMPYGFTRQIDSLLSRYGLKERKAEDTETLSAIAKSMAAKGDDANAIADSTGLKADASGRFVPESISDFVARVNDNYFALSLPETVMNGAEKGFKELKLTELRELRDGAKSLQNVGQFIDRYLEADRKMTIKQAAATFRASVEENFGSPMASRLLPGSDSPGKVQDMLQAIGDIPAAFDRALDTISTTCRKLDGLQDGPAQDNISRPLQAAADRKLARTHEVISEVEAIMAKHYKPDEFAKYKDTRIQTGTRADGSPEYFTKEQILSMALNWGNEGNKQRLMDGFKFSEAKVQDLFKHLGANDWAFAQDTWDHIQKYWPEITKLEMDVAGVEPRGVEPSAFENEHGKFEGGYYPIAYDFEKSSEAYKNAQEGSALYKSFSTAKAMTDQGHTEARASRVERPLRLSLDVLKSHHEDVIHDLEFRRAVVDVSRFLNQTDTKAALMNALGVKGYNGIGDWLKAAASPPSEPLSMGEQAMRWFRFKTTMFSMAYRLASAPKIGLENMVNLSSELGVSGASRAMKDYLFSGKGTHEMIVDKSPFMKERAHHLDRDQSDLTKQYSGEKGSALQHYAFAVHAYLDQAVSFPLWHDVYSRGMGEHGDEKTAIMHADEAVRRTFMSGSETNQAMVMRGPEALKAVTVAFGYNAMMWNRFSEQKFAIGQEWAAGNKGAAIAVAARASLYTFIMPAAIVALSRELVRNGQGASNSDDRKKRIAGTLIEEATPLKFLPVVRDLTPYLVKKSLGEHQGDFQASPLERAAQTLLDPAGELFQSAFMGKRLPDKFPEQAVNALSYAAGIPKSIDDLAFNFIDWQKTHGNAAWQDFVTRRTKK